jgi:hypothetical protein
MHPTVPPPPPNRTISNVSDTPKTEPTALSEEEVIPHESALAAIDPATSELIDDILTRNRIETTPMFEAERRAGAPTSTKVKIFLIIAVVVVVLGIIPIFIAPLLLDRTTRPTTTDQVLAALSAFSTSRDGHSAKSGLVREVTVYARITVTGATTIYALPAGSSCYGVSITNGVAGPAQVEPAAACS